MSEELLEDSFQKLFNLVSIQNLLQFYEQEKRILPWREDPTPYHVWISEIMLQQTRVEAVKGYYTRFLEVLPSIDALARCDEDVLLKLWEGLGYYNRARNLQKAAKILVKEYGGVLPQTEEELLKLPGIGSYTCGAILSFAYNKPKPAIDGNVLRVLTRLSANPTNILDPAFKKACEKALEPCIPPEQARQFNSALMELGATVCGPDKAPECFKCPMQKICRAHLLKEECKYPQKDKQKPKKVEEWTVLLIQNDVHILLEKRPDKGLLASLYGFPMLKGAPSQEELQTWVRNHGMEPLRLVQTEDSTHVFTHKVWNMHTYLVQIPDGEPFDDALLAPYFFEDRNLVAHHYSIPSAFHFQKEYIFKKENLHD